MPKVTFSEENKQSTSTDYPRLSLDYDEKALIVCIETEPTKEYVHSLNAPEVGPDGRVIKETATTDAGKEYERVVTEYFGSHLCFGNFDTLESGGGIDPDGCPTCRAAVEEEGILPPKPRFGIHVLQYAIEPGTFNVRDPFNVNLVAWTFGQERMNTLIDIAKEWGSLQKHDLKLGPCKSKKFQKYDIQVAKSAQWFDGLTALDDSDEAKAAQKARQELAAKTYKHNQVEDLSTLIGKRIDKTRALEDISRVLERMAQAYGKKSTAATDLSSLSTVGAKSDAIDNLLGADEPSTEAASEKPANKSTEKKTLEEIMAEL